GFSLRARIGGSGQVEELPFQGAGRYAARREGGFLLALAAVGRVSSRTAATGFVRAFADAPGAERPWDKLAEDIPATGRLPLSKARIRQAADAARRHAAGGRAAGTPGLFTLRAERAEAEPIAIRATLLSERDAWHLRQGQTSVVQAAYELFAPTSPNLLGYEFTGTLNVVTAAGDDSLRTLVLRIKGFAQIITTLPGEPAPDPVPVVLDLTVTLRQSVQERSIEIKKVGDPRSGGTVIATIRWGGSPLTVDGTLGGAFHVVMDEDAGIFQAGNEAHQMAADALSILQGAHSDDPGYLERTLREQFGAESGQPSTKIRAPLDWVLFRRRTHEVTAPPPTALSQVVVWVATAPNADDAAARAAALREGQGGQIAWRRVRTVQFEPGSSTSRTEAADVRAAYSRAGGAELIRFAGYGAGGAMPAGRTRTETLMGMLPPVAELDDAAQVDEIADPPPAFLEADTDGSVFIVSYREPASTPAYRIHTLAFDRDRNIEFAKPVIQAITGGDVLKTEEFVGKGLIDQLGEVPVADDGRPEPDAAARFIDEARRAIGNRIIDNGTPLLWVDPEWSRADANRFDGLLRLVKEGLLRIRDRLELARTADVAVGAEVPAWLFFIHTKG
ncbi:MAG TPA: hypothetical protein VGF55_19070, partial [Gemmataceae bacterium]